MPGSQDQRLCHCENYMRRCVRFRRPKATQSQTLRAIPHVLVTTLLVAGLAVLMTLTAGGSESSLASAPCRINLSNAHITELDTLARRNECPNQKRSCLFVRTAEIRSESTECGRREELMIAADGCWSASVAGSHFTSIWVEILKCPALPAERSCWPLMMMESLEARMTRYKGSGFPRSVRQTLPKQFPA